MCIWGREPLKTPPRMLLSIGPGSSHVLRFLVSPEVQDDAWHFLESNEGKFAAKEINEDEHLNDSDQSLGSLLTCLEVDG